MIQRPPRGQSREDSLQLSYNTTLIKCQKVMVENTESRSAHTYTQANSLTQKHIPHWLTFWGLNKPNKLISAYREGPQTASTEKEGEKKKNLCM